MARCSVALSFTLDAPTRDLVLRAPAYGRPLDECIADAELALDARVVALYARQRAANAPAYKSKEWHAARAARIGGSEAAAVLGKNRYESVERLWKKRTGQLARDYGVSKYMVSWGTRLEDEAMRVYAALTRTHYVSDNTGSVVHPEHAFIAATPDFVTARGVLVEIKCPRTRTIGHHCPENYYPQLQFQLACTGLDVCHFVQYRPPYLDAPGELDVLVVHASPRWFAAALEPCRVFCAAVAEFYLRLGKLDASATPNSDVRRLNRTLVARAEAEVWPRVKRSSEWARAFVDGPPDPPVALDAPDLAPDDDPATLALWMRVTSDVSVFAN